MQSFELTTQHSAVILMIEGAIGKRSPSPQFNYSKEVTACLEAGRLLSFCLKTKANDANNNQTELEQIRISHTVSPPSYVLEGEKKPPSVCTERGEPPTD